jgi:7,8-dihydroneopterin aldolase/epimerase/oxygenase
VLSVFVNNFELETIVGVYPEEKHTPQRIRLNIEIGVPSEISCETDRLRDTVDYASVVAFVRKEIDGNHFVLLERMADHLCRATCTYFHAPWMTISIAKPDKIPGVAEVGVRMMYEAESDDSISAI